MGSSASYPKYNQPSYPKFQPINTADVENTAVSYDATNYGLSDKDFARRHPEMLAGEHAFTTSAAAAEGKAPTGFSWTPQMQNQNLSAGLSASVGNLGGDVGALTPGSAGQANVAKNFGLSQLGFQQAQQQELRTEQNQTDTRFSEAEQLAPRRSFGLSGADAANIYMANVAGENNWKQGAYASSAEANQFNTNLQAQQAQANAQSSNSSTGGIISTIGTVIGAIAMAY